MSTKQKTRKVNKRPTQVRNGGRKPLDKNKDKTPVNSDAPQSAGNAPIASTTFSTGADKQTATVDVYAEIQTNQPINNIQRDTKLDSRISDTYTPPGAGNIFKAPTIGDLIKTNPTERYKEAITKFSNAWKGGNAIRSVLTGKNPEDWNIGKDIVGGYLSKMGYGGSIDSIKNLVDGGKNINDIANVFGVPDQYVKLYIDGKEYLRQAKDINNIKELADLVGAVTGENDFWKMFGLGETISMYGSIINHAIELGIPEITDRILKEFDYNPEEQRLLILQGLYKAAKSSDLDFITRAITHKEIGVGKINAYAPDLYTVLLTHFNSTDWNKHPTRELARTFVDILYQLNPKWDKYNRNGQEILSLKAVANCSDFCCKVLMLDERTIQLGIMGGHYKTVDMVKHTLNMFPYTPVNILEIKLGYTKDWDFNAVNENSVSNIIRF